MLVYLTANWSQILTAITAVHAAALVIVNLTKTPKDDEVLTRVYHIIEILAGVVTKLVKK